MTTPAYLNWRRSPTSVTGQPLTLHEWQDGLCAMCGHRTRLVRDHCHTSGLIRGLLCHGCNLDELDNDADHWRAYRERPPTALLGIEEVYLDQFGKPVIDPPPTSEAERRYWADRIRSLPSPFEKPAGG